MAVKQKDLNALPNVSGDDFSLLAHAFRDYMLAVQDTPEQVAVTLIELCGWDGDEAARIAEMVADGVAAVEPAHCGADPRAEQWKKDTTIVRRKRRG